MIGEVIEFVLRLLFQQFPKYSFTWSLSANLIQNFIQIGCDSYWIFISISKYPTDDGYIILSYGILVPSAVIYLILFEANRIKFDASKIAVSIHNIRKNKSATDLYKMVSSLKYY